MGTQWCGMGLSLMRLPAFRDSILRSDKAVKPLGLQVSDLLMSPDEATFDDTVHAFVSLTAIQVRPPGLGSEGPGEWGRRWAWTWEGSPHGAMAPPGLTGCV